jgi:hypothetical protein
MEKSLMKMHALALTSLLPLLAACGSEAPESSAESLNKNEQAQSSPWSRVLFTGSFHVGGEDGILDVAFVDESNVQHIADGHGGYWLDQGTWQDPYGYGQIHFSVHDVPPMGGLVIWPNTSPKIKGSYTIDYLCTNSQTQRSRRHETVTQTYATSTPVSLQLLCDDNEFPTFFTGAATFHPD